MTKLAAGRVAAIFEAMPVGEWVTVRDVHGRFGIGALSTTKKGLLELVAVGAVEVKFEMFRANYSLGLYRRIAA